MAETSGSPDHGRAALIGGYAIAALLAILGAILELHHSKDHIAFTLFGQEFTRGGIAAAGLFLGAIVAVLVAHTAAHRSRIVVVGDIDTAGKNSPGFVQGDYTVTSGSTPAAAAPRPPTPIEKVMVGQVTTTGDNSPGVLLGNYTVHIDQQIINNAEVKKRKVWRPLTVQTIPLISTSEVARLGFVQTMCLALANTYGAQPWTQFVSAFTLEERTFPDNHQAFVATAISQRPEFCRRIVELTERDLKEFYPLHQLPFNSPERNALLEQIKATHGREMEQLYDSFNLQFAGLTLGQMWTPLQFTVDGVRKIISIEALEASTQYSTFPDKLQTTSELLRFLSGFTASRIIHISEMDYLTKNPSLLRLLADVLDHNTFLVDSVRISLDDPEEWDYVNPSFDAESGLSRK